MVEWVWDRLHAAIIAPIGPQTYFEPEDPSNPFDMSDERLKNITFPTPQRLDKPREPEEHEVSSISWGQPTSNTQPMNSEEPVEKRATGKTKEIRPAKLNKKDTKRESGVSKIFKVFRG